MLQLLSLTLAYDDTRFFGSVMFTDPSTQTTSRYGPHRPRRQTALVPPHQRRPGRSGSDGAGDGRSGPHHAVPHPLHARTHRPHPRRLPAALTPPARPPFGEVVPDDASGVPAPLERPDPLGHVLLEDNENPDAHLAQILVRAVDVEPAMSSTTGPTRCCRT